LKKNPKLEIRNPKQYQNSNFQNAKQKQLKTQNLKQEQPAQGSRLFLF